VLRSSGYSLPELLTVVALIGLCGSLSLENGSALLARRRLEAATRALEQEINRARAQAIHRKAPCGMRLDETAWRPPAPGSALEPCFDSASPWPKGVRLQHNFPELLRFTGSGLVLDGGTVVLTHPGTDLQRCLVMGLPMGVVRLGRMGEAGCAVDQSL